VAVAAVVVLVALGALGAGFVVPFAADPRVMDYHSHLDDSFGLESAHTLSHGGGSA